MLSIFSAFVSSVVSVIVEKAISAGHNDMVLRRSVLAKLLGFYDALQDLRKASQIAMNEFEGYAQANITPTKIVSAKRLAEIADKFQTFRSKQRDLVSALEIYDPDITVLISRTSYLKISFFWNVINLTDKIVPRMDMSGDKKSFNLVYPTTMPEYNHREYINPKINSTDELVKATKKQEQNSLKEMNFVTVDIRNSIEMQEAVKDARLSIDTMIEAEEAILNLIRENFSIEKIFEIRRS